MDLVLKCHSYGVNDVFISGVTFCPYYQQRIRSLNKLLKENAVEFKYTFIDNSDIEERHLWKDNYHLNKQGTINLANNFIDALNFSSNYNIY